MKKATFIQGLRDVADWLEATPSATTPEFGLEIANYSTGVVTLADIARSGGEFDKQYGQSMFSLSRTFANEDYGTVKVTYYADRQQVCTKRVVGTKTVTVPAVEAQPERVEEQEIVEWDCIPLLQATNQ